MNMIRKRSQFAISYVDKEGENIGTISIEVIHDFPIIKYPFHNLISAYTLHRLLKSKGYKSSIINCYILQLKGGDSNFSEK